MDIFILTFEEINFLKNNAYLTEILEKGKVVYERTN